MVNTTAIEQILQNSDFRAATIEAARTDLAGIKAALVPTSPPAFVSSFPALAKHDDAKVVKDESNLRTSLTEMVNLFEKFKEEAPSLVGEHEYAILGRAEEALTESA